MYILTNTYTTVNLSKHRLCTNVTVDAQLHTGTKKVTDTLTTLSESFCSSTAISKDIHAKVNAEDPPHQQKLKNQ